MNRKVNVVLWVILLTLAACHRTTDNPSLSEEEYKQHLTQVNRILVTDEKKEIQDFIQRHRFTMDSTGTGLRYEIYEHTKGRMPQPHDQVLLAYKVHSLSGTLFYNFSLDHPDTFRLAEAMQVRGLEEALYLMREGEKARLVLPAHLAYGMIGDDQKIPGATPLFYDIQLIQCHP